RCLPSTTSRKGNPRPHPSHRPPLPRRPRQGDACNLLGADLVWWHHGAWFLPGRPSRTVRCAFHHGLGLHCLRHSLDAAPARRSDVAAQDRTVARVL
ncbi:hypothetical protein BN1708_019314, partial [Verticillium longisporum]